MTTKRAATEPFSLKRWSRRKLESATKAPTTPTPDVSAATPVDTAGTTPSAATATPPVELPPVESLTFDSDFTAFLKPEVDPALQRAALKQLFRDPRFNVMDGLDTYIDDYTKPDPIPPDMLAELVKRFDFTPTPLPAAAAGERDEPSESTGAGEVVPAAERAASDQGEHEPASAQVGAISDATAQLPAQSTTTVPTDAARESTAAHGEGQ
jgi:hypothetical protein